MRFQIAAWCLTGVALFLVFPLHLLAALLAGLLVFELTNLLAARLPERLLQRERAKILSMALLAALVAAAVAAMIFGGIAFFRSDAGSLANLFARMADILDGMRDKLPEAMAASLPDDAAELRAAVSEWLRAHAADVQTAGKEAGRALAHLLVGLIVGAMLALSHQSPHACGPLAAALSERALRFADAFRRIVFAQVKISAVNTVLTAIYLLVILPLCGVHLPAAKSMVAITFVAGLLPVVGNLISNTVIVVVSLSHSLEMALASLVFLVVVHKLEYFLNARIVGAGVGARAWELLVAMLVMEAAFGLPGVIAAPIYYAYLKGELKDQNLI